MGFETGFGLFPQSSGQGVEKPDGEKIENAEQGVVEEISKTSEPIEMTDKQKGASKAREQVAEEFQKLGEAGHLVKTIEFTGREYLGHKEKVIHFIGEIDGHQVEVSWKPSSGPLYGEAGPFVDRAVFKMDGKVMEYDTPEEKSGTMKREFFVKHKDLFLAAGVENVALGEAEKELADMLEKTRDEDAGEVMTDKQKDASEARKAVEEEFKRLGETGHLVNSREGRGFKWDGEIDGRKVEVHWSPSQGPIEEYWRSATLFIDGKHMGDPRTAGELGISVSRLEAIVKEFFQKHIQLLKLANKELVATKGKDGTEKELAEMEMIKPEVKQEQEKKEENGSDNPVTPKVESGSDKPIDNS